MKKLTKIVFISAVLITAVSCFSFSDSSAEKLSKGEQINRRLEEITKVCENVLNSYECAKAIEEQEIKKYPDLVNREGDKLVLKMDDGSEIIYKDEKNIKYFIYAFIPENKVIIVKKNIDYYVPVYDLINKTKGDKIITSKINFPIYHPVFSPNGNEFVLYVVSEMEPITGIEIWKIENGEFINEFEDDEFRYFKNIEWVNNNNINIYYNFINKDEKKWESKILKLERKNSEWIIIKNN